MSLNETERDIIVRLQLQKAFGQFYVTTGIFTIEEGKHYSRLQGLREKSDYNCSYDASEAEIAPKIVPTRLLIEKIEHYIYNKK